MATAAVRRVSLTDLRYMQYNRKVVEMSGPGVLELVSTGKLHTPYPGLIADNFPLENEGGERLIVMVEAENKEELEAKFGSLNLSAPEPEHAIRFASQLGLSDANRGRLIVFPHLPVSVGVQPEAPSWFALAWRPQRRLSELCLYLIERPQWPCGTIFAGVANP
jgi:hypothetical protein